MLHRERGILFTVLAVFVIFYLFTKFFGPIPFSISSVTTTKTDLFTVEGVGEATGIPDTALLSLGVTKKAATIKDAQNQVNQAANAMIADLKKLGIDEKNIKTTNYSVYPDYDYTRGQTITGYSVSENLEVKVTPIEKANQAIDIATKDGANMVGGITFILNEDIKKSIEQEARKDAVKKAKEKAQNLASAAGIRLGKIVNVQESQGYQPPIALESSMLKDGGTGEPTQLTPGESTIRTSITLSYEIF
ncbi:MAG: SIMPL domain-containing protein [Candidatus Levybacteria bacterium]|nr:SIMPL domain-containing protein [Candidatus Levybacteria bacterium]